MGDECPDLEMLAAFAEGGLLSEEREIIESHLVECDTCLEVVVFVFRVMREVPPVTPD